MRKRCKNFIVLLVILIIFSSFLFSPLFLFHSNSKRNSTSSNLPNQEPIKLYSSAPQWGTDSFSIQEGDNLYEDHEYTFSGLYYNDSDYTAQYSDALLEIRDIWSNQDNYSISDLTTLYSEYYDSITSYFGSYADDSNLDSDDGNLANFFSTNYQTVINNINPIYGTETLSGDLEYIDSDYSEYESNTEYDQFDGSYNIYNGTLDTEGDLESIDGNYTTINSSSIEYAYPSSFDINQGSQESSGDLHSIDGSYYMFNSSSTQTNFAHNNNLTIYSGALDTIGDLESIDNNYTIINSSETGHYPATYSFYNETGETGTNIDFVDASTFATCVVEHEKDGHKDVLKTVSSGTYQTVDNTFSSQTTGIIEFWIYCEENNKARSINIRDTNTGNNEIILVFRSTGKISNYVGTSYFDFADYSADTWHHLKLQFYCSNHTYDVWVDEVSYGNKNNYGSYANVEALRFNSWADSGETTWWDAIGYSWDTNYTIGDNLVGSNAIVNCTIEFESSFDIASVLYSYNTSISQSIETYFWNYDTSEWYLFANQSYSSFIEVQFTDFNSSFTNINNSIMIMFYGENDTNDFQFNLEECITTSKSYLNVTSTFQANINSIAYFSYAYNTSTYQQTNFSIWNYDTSEWDLVDDSIYLTFSLQSFTNLNSSYYNASNYFQINFYGENDTNTFQINLEVLRVNSYSSLNITMNYQLSLELRTLRLLYSYATNISQSIEFSIYNFDASSFNLLKNESLTSFSEYLYSMNSSYYNSSHYVMFNFYGLNATNEFQLQIEELKVQNSPKLVLEINQTTSLYDNLIYSYKTNITQPINFSIYNNDLSDYEILNSSYVGDFALFIFGLNSSYYNGSAVHMKFEGINTTFNEFVLRLEVMKIRNVSYLNHSIFFDDITYDTLLQLEVYAEYMTNISQTINFSIWDSSSFELINSGVYESLTEINEVFNSSNVYDYINSSYTIELNFYGENITHPFNLSVDYLYLKCYEQLELSYDISFGCRGAYRYRFWVRDIAYGLWVSSDWIGFDVIAPEPNLELLSESQYTTDWVFIGTESAGTVDLYESDLSSEDWTSNKEGENITLYRSALSSYLSDEGYTLSSAFNLLNTYSISRYSSTNPTDLVYYNGYFYVTYSDGALTGGSSKVAKYTTDFTFVEDYSVCTDPSGITFYNNYFWVVSTDDYQGDGKVYQYDTSFNYIDNNFQLASSDQKDVEFYNGYWWSWGMDDEIECYYANETHIGTYKNVLVASYGGTIHHFNGYWWLFINSKAYKYNDTWDYTSEHFSLAYTDWGSDDYDEYWWIVQWSDERVHQYDNHLSLGAFLQSSAYTYIQTNTSETVTIKTNNNLNLELQEGDRIEITYNTSSSNRIDLNLLNNNVTQKSLILSSQGNSIFTDQTDTLIVDSDYTVDQLEFSSLFDATDNLIIKNIHIYRYNESTNSYSYKVDPDGLKQIYLNFPVNFSYFVYENGLEVLSGNITTSNELQTISYERIDQSIIYINYYDINNEHLNFQDYTTYVNFTYQGSSVENRRLSSAIMYADEETQIEFEVYDSFDSLIKTATKNVQNFIDLELPVFELKIKSAAEEYVSYSLESNDTGETKSGMIFPEEIIKFSIASGDYILTYTNYEDEVERTYEFTLTDNTLITINTTYYQTYLGAYIISNNETLPWNEVKFYINGSRSDFGFNTLTSDYVQLTILDYFNNTLYNETRYLRGQMEYDMFVDISKLIILNNYRHRDITITIREGNITRTEIINPLQSKTLQLAPNSTYTLTTSNTLQDLLLDYYFYGFFLPAQTKTITLSGESQTVDFGFYKTEVSSMQPITDLASQMVFIVLFFSIIIIVVIVLFMYMKKIIDEQGDELGSKHLRDHSYNQRAALDSHSHSLITHRYKEP